MWATMTSVDCRAESVFEPDLTVEELQCEGRLDPLGVDATAPRLSWRLESAQRGARQSAYQILAARSAGLLDSAKADLWDTGKVASEQQVHIPYTGQPLQSSETVHWKVRVWDGSGRPSEWSPAARWTIGLLSPEDWKAARWIGRREPEGMVEETAGYNLRGHHSKPVAAAEGEHWVQIHFQTGTDIDRIVLLPLTHAGVAGFGFPVRFKIEVSASSNFENPRILVDHTTTDVANPGAEPLTFSMKGSGIRTLRITTTRLAELPGAKPGERYAFALDEVQVFAEGRNVAIGQNVTASSSLYECGWGRQALTRGVHSPEYVAALERSNKLQRFSVRLRRDLALKPGMQRALWHGCGLGHGDLEINGRRATADRLTPGWTDYRKTVVYDTLDVTPLLKEGANTIGMTLAGGMYRVPVTSRYAKFSDSFGPFQAIGLLVVDYKDGTREEIPTDETWQLGPSPIVFNTIYAGEDHDARLEQPGWCRPDFKPGEAWKPAAILDGPGGVLRGLSQAAPPVREIEVLKPVGTCDVSPAVRVYDLGQNAALVPRITVRGPAGSSVKITPSELIHPQGGINDTMCGGKSYCVYTLAGSGRETWQPQFYYRGARYLQVELSPAETGGELPSVETLEGVVQHSSAPAAGTFACSNDLFNCIYTLVRWAQRSNIMSVLTDCPQREKLGWLEETHLNGPALRYNFDLNLLFEKITRDMRDAQTPEGLVPDTAPEFVNFGENGFRDSPEWGSAIALVPWQQYEFTGDLTLLASSYEAIERYVAYLGGKAEDGILDHGLGDWYDIGPKPPGESQLTPVALTATAFYYQDAEILHQAAVLLGKKDAAEKYKALAQSIREAFQARFYDARTHQFSTGSQCANSIPLVMDLVPRSDREAVLAHVVEDVEKNGMTAGDVGYRYLLCALSEGGRSDVIHALNNQSDKPGYGMQLKRGATALTEAWDALPSSSQNHFMLGQINEWFFHDLAGIRFDREQPGFGRIRIDPVAVGDLTWVKASYRSNRGLIRSEWRKDGGQRILAVSIPANTTASVFVPARDFSAVTESGKPASESPGVKFLRMEGPSAVFEIGSGTYRFASPL